MIDLKLPQIASGEDKSSPFKNRIRKNYRNLKKWAKKNNTDAFRLYGTDIKEYPLSIDVYAGRFYVQYYSSNKEEEEGFPKDLKEEIEETLISTFGISPDFIYYRSRIKRSKLEQYEKIAEEKQFFVVTEHGAQFKVNLQDYLDTGLFLDHRKTRQMIATLSKGKRLLNLFAYTCSFSIQAALAGAVYTKSVDMSNTYTEWGKENFILNNLPLKNNSVVKADCLKFLDEELFANLKYDVIIIDPPTISRSKKMDQMFDIQVDYIPLIAKALTLLAVDGTLFFSTNSRKFTFDPALFPYCTIEDISKETIPEDFRNPKIHKCWKITK
jgi:23S rRNA (cytosine1962-C5)-methyltransferase